MTSSTCIRAPEESIRRAQLRDARPWSSGVPRLLSRSFASADGQGVERQRDEHRALALDQVVAGRLAGHRRVAEDAEQVVAQLEGLAEREAEAAELGDLRARRRRPGRRRCGGGARWSTSPTCSAAPSSPCPRRPRPRAWAETSRNCPVDDLAAGEVEVAERVEHPLGGQAAGAQQLVGPAEQQVAEQDRGGGAVLLGRSRTSRARGAAARRRGAWPAGRGVRRRRPCSRRAPARSRAAAPARRRPAASAASSVAARRRPGGPTSRTPPGTACRRRRWCARARPVRCASGPSGVEPGRPAS